MTLKGTALQEAVSKIEDELKKGENKIQKQTEDFENAEKQNSALMASLSAYTEALATFSSRSNGKSTKRGVRYKADNGTTLTSGGGNSEDITNGSAGGTTLTGSGKMGEVTEESVYSSLIEHLGDNGITGAHMGTDDEGNTYVEIPVEYPCYRDGKAFGQPKSGTIRVVAHNISEDSDAYIVQIGGQNDNFGQGGTFTGTGTTASGRLAYECDDNNVGMMEIMFVEGKGKDAKYGEFGASVMATTEGRELVRGVDIACGETLDEVNPDVPKVSGGHSIGGQVKLMELFVGKDADGNLDEKELKQVKKLYDTFDIVMPQDVNHDTVNRVTGKGEEGKNFTENVPGELILDEEKFVYGFGTEGLVATADKKRTSANGKSSAGVATTFTKLLTADGNLQDISKEEGKNEQGKKVTKLYTENENSEKEYIQIKTIEMTSCSHTHAAWATVLNDDQHTKLAQGPKGLLTTYLHGTEEEKAGDILTQNYRKRLDIQKRVD